MSRAISEEQKQRARERAKAWHWANRDRANAASLAWAEKNRLRARERTLRWRAENPERARENDAKKRANRSPEYLERRRIDEQNRRARIKAAGGVLSKGLGKRLFDAQEGKCIYCRCDISAGFELDHIVALAVGGKHEDANIQLLCKACNRKKHTKTHEEFVSMIRG